MGVVAADEVRGEVQLGIELVEGGQEAVDEVASASAAAGVVAEADDELVELPDATNRHGTRSRARARARVGCVGEAMADGAKGNTGAPSLSLARQTQ